jgi:hypothetical protein
MYILLYFTVRLAHRLGGRFRAKDSISFSLCICVRCLQSAFPK